MPAIPEHFKDGSWKNRFDSPQSAQKEKANADKSTPKKQLIAFGDEAISQDPITKLFEIIVGGAIIDTFKTLKDAYDFLQHTLHSTSDDSAREEQEKKQKAEGDKSQQANQNQNRKPKIEPDKTIEQQLEGKGQIRDLERSGNWQERIGVREALKKTYKELKDMVSRGELTKRGLRQIEKAFEGRDLGKRGGGGKKK
jgi:hypothetical protein